MSGAKVEIRFYHLEDSSVEQDLPILAAKMREAGGHALILVGDPDKAASIDKALWTFDPTSFLPHGIDTGDAVASQHPILISTTGSNTNSARFLVMIDGYIQADPQDFDRAFYMFDGRQQATVEKARDDWKNFKSRGHELSYWQKSAKGWARKDG